MKLSPLDLRKQQFKKKFGGGYDPDEVRGFIEKLASDWEEVLEDQRQAEQRVRELEAKLKHYEKVELALQEALDAARETARRAEDAAGQRARLIVEEAELRAQRMLQDAEQERYNIRQDVVKLSSRQAEITARLRAFLFSEIEMLAHFQGDDPAAFLRAAREQGTLPAATSRPASPPLAGTDEPAPPEEPHLPLDEATPPASDAAPEAAGLEGAAPEKAAPADEQEAEREPLAQAGPRRFTTPVEPESVEAPDASGREAEAPAEAEPPGPTAEPEPEPARTYHDVLSGRTGAQEQQGTEKPSPGTGPSNPFATPFFRSPFFREEDEAAPAEPQQTEPHRTEPALPAPGSDAAQGWSLRSLVTGEDAEEPGSVAATDEERERIRRILNDLD